jgi:hypothetical protein
MVVGWVLSRYLSIKPFSVVYVPIFRGNSGSPLPSPIAATHYNPNLFTSANVYLQLPQQKEA